ncbi:MAG: efflux RND transporter permease subunit, partial [Proteobacteria bacterium]|nr:efflux RND transporter permease subunit [Pseudomonadota bacterium]
SILLVFLCLAALYESWSIPFAVILVVPLGVIGAVIAVTLRDMSNDVYFKVGLIAIIGLSAKNAILIIEFAKELMEDGKSLIEATIEACHLRFRPILMTSLAFTLGVLPLAIATGASSGSQRAIGTGVMGGMITATVLAIFFVPVFFVFVMKMFGYGKEKKEEPAPAANPAE